MNIKTSLKAAKIVVTSKTGRSLLKVQKQSPHLLFAAGVVGVVGTAVLASKATLHLDKMLDENAEKRFDAQEHLDTPDNGYEVKHYDQDIRTLKLSLARDIAVTYAPAVGCGLVTIGCFTGSHVILNRRYAGVVAAYSALDQAFRQYRERVVQEIGEDREGEIYRGATERTIIDNETGKPKTVRSLTGLSPYAQLFSKDTSSSWDKEPDYRLVFLRGHETWLNDRLRAEGFLLLNDVYADLGFPKTTPGAVVGWVYDNPKGVGDNKVDFGIFSDRNREVIHDFMTLEDGAIWLDFNVDGVVYDLIDKKKLG